jgi:ABC-type multidrug transport system permease subunit
VTDSKKPAPPASYGTRALHTFFFCFVLGLPLLLAFGLGVLVILYGLMMGTGLALYGLAKDEQKAASVVMLLITATALGGVYFERANRAKLLSAPSTTASPR